MEKILKWMGNVLLRMVYGAIGMFAANVILSYFFTGVAVGINKETLVITGLLGVPGFLMLYGITCYYARI
ncbi:MAG: SigmaK-factor processing regulatory protein BofA [Clostridiales bacterium]|nr:SigmaK-factor processing regulatory protein BofA [Clostridiales bacterium]